jgi:hypothetical protein
MNPKEEQYIKVPHSWLEGLMKKAEAIDHGKDPRTIENLGLLQGYISSAKTLIKYNKL